MIYLASIASAIKKLKSKSVKQEKVDKLRVSKEQSYKWLDEGKCQMCGEPSGEEKGICDECRWF